MKHVVVDFGIPGSLNYALRLAYCKNRYTLANDLTKWWYNFLFTGSGAELHDKSHLLLDTLTLYCLIDKSVLFNVL